MQPTHYSPGPLETNLFDIAKLIYNDSTKSLQLQQLNPWITDPARIPRGRLIKLI